MVLCGRSNYNRQLRFFPSESMLGTFSLGTLVSGGPTGSTCHAFTLAAPGLPTSPGVIADTKPSDPIGCVLFFSGDNGAQFWSLGGNGNLTAPFISNLVSLGYEVVEVKWNNGWTASAPGVQSGQVALAIRPATVIQWVKDNWAQGKFCLSGNSAGAAQVAYSISNYGITADVVALSSGPPLAAMGKGCLNVLGYEYDITKCQLIDQSFGYKGQVRGPCFLHDPSFSSQWTANSCESTGGVYNYPNTKFRIILGGNDNPVIWNHADDYYQVLVSAGQTDLIKQLVPNMGHGIELSADGLAALTSALT